MIRCGTKKRQDVGCVVGFAEVHGFSRESELLCSSPSPCDILVDESAVIPCFFKINPFKAPRPDGCADSASSS